MSGRRLYVYFRVARGDAPAAWAALEALHAGWQREQPALRCELLRRDDEGDAAAELTLMETYAAPQGIDAAWQARIEREAATALAGCRCGARHVEVFVAAAPCA